MPELQSILARIPLLANESGLTITELTGGITNRNFKIEASGAAYVLRLGGNDTGLLGIDRRIEYGCTLAAARVGVAPEPLAFLEPEGYMLTRFVAGRPIPLRAMGAEANIRRVAACLKRYHGLRDFPGAFSPFRIVEMYLPAAQRHRAPLPANLGEFVALAREIEAALLRAPFTPVACHNDLLGGNFIDEAGTLRLLDWEYAGMGDRFFDLANFSAQHEFAPEQDALLLREYFGAEDTSSRLYQSRAARLQLMRVMSDLREALWAMVQCNVSRIDFDYVGYGMKYFRRLEAAVKESPYREWLRAIQPPGESL